MLARRCLAAGALATLVMVRRPANAQQAIWPAPREGTWVAQNFRFHTGEVFPELRLHYRTIGNRRASRW